MLAQWAHINTRVCDVIESKNIPEHVPNSFFRWQEMQERHHSKYIFGRDRVNLTVSTKYIRQIKITEN